MDRDVERDFILSPIQAVEYGLIDNVLASRDLPDTLVGAKSLPRGVLA
jgi:ATP-dependent protease ClpP protease subunit